VRPEKLFRLEEANAEVPRLALLMERLQRGALRLNEIVAEVTAETGEQPAALAPDELLRRRPAARALVEELDAIVGEIQQRGAVLKDVRLGLVDFPSERNGEVVLLCWQFGETEIGFWHRADEGFGGRRPLPGSASPRLLQ
jgi:hypothetical protein